MLNKPILQLHVMEKVAKNVVCMGALSKNLIVNSRALIYQAKTFRENKDQTQFQLIILYNLVLGLRGRST